MATGEQSCDAHRCFHERSYAARYRVRAATCGAFNMGKLVAGQDRADHSAHAHHVALHVVRVACGAGDGDAQRETCLRPAGDGVELFQSRFDYWRRSNWLVVGSAFRCTVAGRTGNRDADRWRLAISGPISVSLARWLQVSRRLSMA